MEKVENKILCSNCGGLCCKKSGCDYFVNDIEQMQIDYIENFLSSGRVSIVAFLEFIPLHNGKLTSTYTLYLRERNINRDVIDLLSMKTTCASLTKDGCYYDLGKRPSGGTTFIPKENQKCYSSVDRLEEMKKWKKHQKVLERIVKRHTGMSVQAKLKEDVVKLFLDVANQNFDNVSLLEISDILFMLPLLKQAFPAELAKASQEYKNQELVKIK